MTIRSSVGVFVFGAMSLFILVSGLLMLFDPARYVRILNAISPPSDWERPWRDRCGRGEYRWLGASFVVLGLALILLGFNATWVVPSS